MTDPDIATLEAELKAATERLDALGVYAIELGTRRGLPLIRWSVAHRIVDLAYGPQAAVTRYLAEQAVQ